MYRNLRKLPRRTLFLVLTLLFSAFLFSPNIPSVHAGGGIAFVQKASNCCSNAASAQGAPLPNSVTVGDALVLNAYVSTASSGQINSMTVQDTFGDAFTLVVVAANPSSGVADGIFFAIAKSTGTDSVTLNTNTGNQAIGYSVMEYSGVSGVGTSGTFAANAQPVTGTASISLANVMGGSVIVEGIYVNTAGTITTTLSLNGQTFRDQPNPCFTSNTAPFGACSVADLAAPSASFSPKIGWSSSGGGGGIIVVNAALELQPSTPASFVLSTSCFGNCGSPAVTLVNTNSTHSINFNQSLTIFYQFQAPLSGTFANVSISLAKTYTSNIFSPYLGLYTASCPVGIAPFTSNCIGNLVIGQNTGAINKGKVSLNLGNNFGVTAGTWVGIAVTAQFSKLDLNDTNTGVALDITNGLLPVQISSFSVLNVASLVGLWTFITGTSVVTPPPSTSAGCANNFAQLDCLLPAMVNAWCLAATANCQTGAALLWILILSTLTFAVIMITVGGAAFRFIGVGYIFVFCFLTWFFIFASFNLILSFIVIMFLFVGAAIFAKSSRGTLGLG